MLLLLFAIFFSVLESYEILPNALLNHQQSCQINCTRTQTFAENFQKIVQCSVVTVRICEGYLGIDFNEGLVSYSLTRTDAADNSSLIRADLMEEYRSYIDTNITAIRFRQLIMKFSPINPHRLNMNYYCRTQIDDCAYHVYVANRHILKRIQPIFYDQSIVHGTPILCITDIITDNSSLCSGYCTLTFNFHNMTKNCSETLPSDALGINMSLGLAYPDYPQYTAQVSSVTLICNKPNCNSNASVNEALTIVKDFLTAQSIGTGNALILHPCLILIYLNAFFSLSQ